MRYCALLRAINVGGRTVKMADLKKIFEAAGFTNVETYIASGNLVFDPGRLKPEACEKRLASVLLEKLDYDHTPFVRTLADVREIAEYAPFSAKALASARANHIGLAGGKIGAAAAKRILALNSAIDDFHVHGSEIYWLSRKGMGESKITKSMFEKAVGGPVTWRNVNTIRAIAERWSEQRKSKIE